MSEGGVVARSRSLGAQSDELVRVLRAFEPGEFSGADCAQLVATFARAEKALAAARTRAAVRAASCNEHRKEGASEAIWADGARARPYGRTERSDGSSRASAHEVDGLEDFDRPQRASEAIWEERRWQESNPPDGEHPSHSF